MELSAQLVTLNRNLALSRVGGDEELYQEIASIYLEEYPTLVAEIETAIQAGDASGLLNSAHTLKGSASAVGGEIAAHFALQLESMGRTSSLEGASEALGALQQALDTLRHELASV